MMTDTPNGAEAAAPETAQAETAPDPAAQLAKEAADLKDRLLRTLAEMENLRRRTEREVADARSYGVTNFARDILAVADNMERALKALDDEIREKAEAGVKALLDGVELTERELIKAMEKHGVKKLEPQGQKFDPNLHQAMFEIPDESVPAGTVVQIMQPGYTIGERVLRPALVGVSKGGPKAQASAHAAAEAAANDNSGK
jgi:molecular chaperone GrpE